MASKQSFSLAEAIRGSVGEASVAALDAQAVPDLGTEREQITYIPRTSLVADERNFYSVEGIDELAANIETVGLLDPLRVRPVLMTTLTTILALVPMALGIGEANEMLSSMGLAMISGMTISTVITLLFTPVYYCVIDNITSKFKRKQN